MENLTGGTPPVRYLPCVVPCKLYFLIALIYWSCGFTLYVVFPPMPFLVGYYIMNHRIILGISWCIEAILIYVSFET